MYLVSSGNHQSELLDLPYCMHRTPNPFCQAYDDFAGCAALACSRCPCRFCAWCLADCGDDVDGAHAHVRNCPEKPLGVDPYFPRPRAAFDSHWTRRKLTRVEQMMQRVSLAVRHAVYADLEGPLGELGYVPLDEVAAQGEGVA